LVAVISLIGWFTIELNVAKPFVNLRLLARRNFGLGAIIGMVFGAGMYGATYLLPLYLAQVQGYNAQQIGQTIMWSGMPQLVMMPLAVVLLRRFDARLLLTIGLVLFSASSFLNASLTSFSGYDQLRWTQLIRAIGMPLVIVPITTLATGLIEPEQSGSASALFNMFRNLGGSIGIAMLATQLDLREKFHSVRLGEAVTAFSSSSVSQLGQLAQQLAGRGSESIAAGQQALVMVAGKLRREAFVMAYSDCFFLLGALIISMVVLVWFCRPTKPGFLAAH
jgi:DHA2 family multidrug resistance protein